MSDYKFNGKLSDENGKGVGGVTITITYREGVGEQTARGMSYQAVRVNPQVGPKTITTTSLIIVC